MVSTITVDNFKCKCCGATPKVSKRLLKILNDIQTNVGSELTILSPTCKDQEFKKLLKACVILVPKLYTVDDLADLAIRYNADGIRRLYKYKAVYVDVLGNKMDY